MKFSEIENLFENYQSARWSPSRMNVHFGCDCGCGGHRYSREEWDTEEFQAQQDIDNMKEWCHTMGINYDGID